MIMENNILSKKVEELKMEINQAIKDYAKDDIFPTLLKSLRLELTNLSYISEYRYEFIKMVFKRYFNQLKAK